MTTKSKLPRYTSSLLLLIAASAAGAQVVESPANIGAMLAATVSIKTVSHVHTDVVGDSVWSEGAGSGVLVSAERCEVWTNHHVIDDAAFVEALIDGAGGARRIEARIVGSIADPDVAVLELAQCDGIAVAPIGNAEALSAGDAVFATGNPFGSNPNTVTRGIVSNPSQIKDSATPFIQTDAAINRGNSGGPLFDTHGRVVGLNAALMTDRGSVGTGVAYAIPIGAVHSAAEQIRNGQPHKGDIGISGAINLLEPHVAALLGVPGGLTAVSIGKEPDAEPAVGRLQMRDVIYRIDGAPVRTVDQVERSIAQKRAGSSVELSVVRGGVPMSITLEARNGWRPAQAADPETYEGLLGLELTSWADEPGPLGKYRHPVITRIHDLGPAHAARISSSQKNARAVGPVLARYLLDVRMITGAVLEGEYISVDDANTLEQLARRAFDGALPLLLEVSSWRPESPRRPGRGMRHYNSEFHRIVPARSLGGESEATIDLTATGAASIEEHAGAGS